MDKLTIKISDIENQALDILNRQPLVERLISLIDVLSSQKSSCMFALNGKWGCGKTFLLENMLEKQLRDIQAGEKYIVFHYNCWEYDYYEEPIVAIVSALYSSLNEQTQLLPKSAKAALKKVLRTASGVLKNIMTDLAKNKIGVDIVGIAEEANSETNNMQREAESYDQYLVFKEALENSRKNLNTLAKQYSLVIVVDELDRCIPDYAIKVLERLHHLFSNVQNTTVILAVDKVQLEETVKKTFGRETDVDTYLKKFISFQIEVDYGNINQSFMEKYKSYFNMFENTEIAIPFDVEKYLVAIFSDIPIREQEHLMEKMQLAHNLLFKDDIKDYSFLCFELMWIVFTQHYNFSKQMPISWDREQGGLSFDVNVSQKLSEYVKNEWRDISVSGGYSRGFSGEKTAFAFNSPLSIPALLVWYLNHMYPDTDEVYQISNPDYDQRTLYVDDFKKLADLLKLIE